jgi:hypothetical protein
MRVCCEAESRASRRLGALIKGDVGEITGVAHLAFAGTDLPADAVLRHLQDRTDYAMELVARTVIEGILKGDEAPTDVAPKCIAGAILHAFLMGFEAARIQAGRA